MAGRTNPRRSVRSNNKPASPATKFSPKKKAVKAKADPPQKKIGAGSSKKQQPRNNSRGKGVTVKGAPAKGKAPSKGKGGKPNAKGPANKKGGRGGEKKKPLTQEELDKELDDYRMKDDKTKAKVLEEQMDEYWEEAKKAKEAASKDGAKEGEKNEEQGAAEAESS